MPREQDITEQQAVLERLDRLEAKLDALLGFAAGVEAAAAPFLKGKGAKYLALYAKAGGRSTQ